MGPVTVSALLLLLLGVAWSGEPHWDDYPSPSLQKRAGGADQFSQPGAGWQEVAAVTAKNNYNQQVHPTAASGQYAAKVPAKGGATVSSSASRVRPDLLKWVKFW